MSVKKTKGGAEALQFICSILERNPDTDYATVRDKCEARGFRVFPIMFGRARALLRQVPVAKRGLGIVATRKRKQATLSQPIDSQLLSPARKPQRQHDSAITSPSCADAVLAAIEAATRRLDELDRERTQILQALGKNDSGSKPFIWCDGQASDPLVGSAKE